MQLFDLMRELFVKLPRKIDPEPFDFYEETTLEPESEGDGLSAYLHKADVILTLVREKKAQQRRFSPDRLFEMLSQAAMERRNERQQYRYIIDVAAKKIILPALQKMAEQRKKATSIKDVDLSLIYKILGDDVTVEPLDGYEYRLLSALTRSKDPDPTGFAVIGRNGVKHVLYAGILKEAFRGSSRGFRREKRWVTTVDAVSLAEPWLRRYVCDRLDQRRESIPEEDREKDMVLHKGTEILCRILDGWASSGREIRYNRDDVRFGGQDESVEKFRRIAMENGYSPCDMFGDTVHRMLGRQETGKLFGAYSALHGEEPVWDALACATRTDDFRTREFLTAVCSGQYVTAEMLAVMYAQYLVEKEAEADRQEFERAAHTARVFETKKNIPEKYLKAAASSDFNKWFAFVEIDEDCDLEKVTELAREYAALSSAGLTGDDGKDVVQIRFRKLHRHRAAGLYFPTVYCLCVDIRDPGSLVHENMHKIDYLRGKLSEQVGFAETRRLYEEALRKEMKKLSDAQQKVLKGSTKYNLRYFLKPTEVFARCGELYVKEVRGVNNSLCAAGTGFEYPREKEHPELYRAIKAYYDGLFKFVEKPEEEKGGKEHAGDLNVGVCAGKY